MRIASRVKLDCRNPEPGGLLHDRCRRVDEETDTNSHGGQPFDRRPDSRRVRRDVEPSFRGDLLSSLRNQGDLLGLEPDRERDHFGHARHLQVEIRPDAGAEPLDIRILNVTAIFPKVRGDAVGARFFAGERSGHWIRLISTPSLPQSRDVIDIDVQTLLLCSHSHRP